MWARQMAVHGHFSKTTYSAQNLGIYKINNQCYQVNFLLCFLLCECVVQYLPHRCTRVVSIAEGAGVKIFCTLWTSSVTVLTWHHRSVQCLLTDRAAHHFIQRNHQLFHLTCLETTGTSTTSRKNIQHQQLSTNAISTEHISTKLLAEWQEFLSSSWNPKKLCFLNDILRPWHRLQFFLLNFQVCFLKATHTAFPNKLP